MRILTDFSNLFRRQTTLTKILFLPPKPGAKYLLTGSKNAQMGTFFQYGITLFTFLFL